MTCGEPEGITETQQAKSAEAREEKSAVTVKEPG